ncbi:uncharacterized protein LOC113501921 isoform X2 [Trichoplusia ni]|uniref:Uncharacterized protein LOC113501921 isoform X1 n=1 Tax=Trichoplusia ni TaxID=7111 RepID=A0A7E5WEE4_TRINI|nr:uncharacterized protein LOC113501921 isoform X1 [Trichoplusia ni]XP_026739035.1 uncharacterized protein LOC113501921 isoform X2 [Trichoplusia ni]
MSSEKITELTLEDLDDIDITLMTLRKPTELKKVIDSVPKPVRAVPKNGLPLWYKLGLECKLPVPKMPVGKVIFSRGRIGEDVRRVGLGTGCPRPTFDLTDPYCNNVSYDYVPMHDPHLAHHFAQKPARNRMKQLGFCTKDGRAVCSLKEFNQYRKYLYNQFMDRIHMEMKKLDERARDDLTLKRVETDVARRLQVFTRAEKAREHLEKVAQEHADEWAEKRRAAKAREKKIQARIKYLQEFNEKQRKERATKAREKQNRIKQRVQAAAEMELRRKITMVRQWRTNEKKRLNRLKQERESKTKHKEDEANRKWVSRVDAQNMKIQEEALLLRLYTEDMTASAKRRAKKAEVYAYNTDLELQRIRLANWKLIHGGTAKAVRLVKKMGMEFEKSKRGAKGMSPELAQRMASEAMSSAMSSRGDTLMILGQARARMDMETVLPLAPLRLLDEILESAVMEFARRRVHLLLGDVERVVHNRAGAVFFRNIRPVAAKKRPKPPRWSVQVATELARQFVNAARSASINFGDIIKIPAEEEVDFDLKSVKDRPPTPVPSKTKLAEVTFADRVEDLPDPVAMGAFLPERRKLLEMINASAKLLSRSVSQKVQKGMDLDIGKVTLPHMRHPMEWGEAVEGLALAVVDNRVHADCADVRRTSEFLTYRILKALQREIKHERKDDALFPDPDEKTEDFYVPGQIQALEVRPRLAHSETGSL